MTLLMILFPLNQIEGAINICIIMLAAYLIMSESGSYIRAAVRAAYAALKRSIHCWR